MASRIIAPMIPAMIDDMKPPPPPSPTRLRRKPPMTAPTMPRMMVTMIPPGSSPGMISLAKAPAMSPTMIQNISAVIIFSPLLSLGNQPPEYYILVAQPPYAEGYLAKELTELLRSINLCLTASWFIGVKASRREKGVIYYRCQLDRDRGIG